MVRNLSSLLRQELQNLDKDPESRKQAIKALKLYVKDLDSKTIPLFLELVSETMNVGSPSCEYIISLYEVLARTHGMKTVPHIGNIMLSVVKTMSASKGSVALHQACAKVVQTIARYGIDPTTPDEKKRSVIHSLCKPLWDCLMTYQESLSAGAALCLMALVESDNWCFASNKTVNEVCLRVAGVLEGKVTQTNLLVSLVMALVKHNALIVEAYARLLVHSGLRILQAGVVERNSQKRLSAIQMVNFLLKSLDPRSVFPELGIVIEKMEKCQSDPMDHVNGAAYECLVTAKGIIARNGSTFKLTGSHSGSNNITRESIQSYMTHSVTHSLDSSFASHESQTLGSFTDNDSFRGSLISTSHSSCNNGHSRSSANRNGEAASSPRTRSLVNTDTLKIYSTPRRLIRSVQDPIDLSPLTGSQYSDDEGKVNGYTSGETEECRIGSESVSSNEDIVPKIKDAVNIVQNRDQSQTECDKSSAMIKNRSYYRLLVYYFGAFFMVLLSVLASYMFLENQDTVKTLVPT